MPAIDAARSKADALFTDDIGQTTADPVSVYGIAEGTINYAAGDDLCSTGEKWDTED